MKTIKHIKVIAPLSDVHEVDPLIKAGVSEVYCGVLYRNKRKKTEESFSTRSFPLHNVRTYAQVEQIVKKAHDHGVQVAVAINKFYVPTQYNDIVCHIDQLAHSGVDVFIIADMNLLLLLKKYNYFQKKIHLSSMAGVKNAKAVALYKKLGCSRIILPRHTALDDIKTLREQHPHMTYETFVLNGNCHSESGLCFFSHDWLYKGKITRMQYIKERIRNTLMSGSFFEKAAAKRQKAILSNIFFCGNSYEWYLVDNNRQKRTRMYKERKPVMDMNIYMNACSACYLGALFSLGIEHMKIIGRAHSVERKVKDVRFILEAGKITLSQKENALTHAYIKEIQQLRKHYYGNDLCSNKYCYVL